MEMFPPTVVLGLILVASGASMFLGAGIGFFASESLKERRQRKINKTLNNL